MIIAFENEIHRIAIMICAIGRYPKIKNDQRAFISIIDPIIVIIKLNVLIGLKIIYIAIKRGIIPLIKNDTASFLFLEKQYRHFLNIVNEYMINPIGNI